MPKAMNGNIKLLQIMLKHFELGGIQIQYFFAFEYFLLA